MKKILVGLLAVTSLSVFANDECSYKITGTLSPNNTASFHKEIVKKGFSLPFDLRNATYEINVKAFENSYRIEYGGNMLGRRVEIQIKDNAGYVLQKAMSEGWSDGWVVMQAPFGTSWKKLIKKAVKQLQDCN